MHQKAEWSTRQYQRMCSARYCDGRLVVEFEDGSCVEVEARSILPQAAREPRWDAVTSTPFEIVIPTADSDVEIPWSTIRARTDESYSAYLGAKAAEQPRIIGARLSELRERRGLSRDEVAARMGVSVEALSRLEDGRAGDSLPTLDSVLDAMGSSLREFGAMGSAVSSGRPKPRRLGAGGSDPAATAPRPANRRLGPRSVR